MIDFVVVAAAALSTGSLAFAAVVYIRARRYSRALAALEAQIPSIRGQAFEMGATEIVKDFYPILCRKCATNCRRIEKTTRPHLAATKK